MGRPKKNKPRGLGDTVETIIKATGLDKLVNDDCGCEARKAALNLLLPYRYKARCVTTEESIKWSKFKEHLQVRIPSDQVVYVCELYASVFNRQVWYPCASCSPKPLINMIDRLDIVFKEFKNE